VLFSSDKRTFHFEPLSHVQLVEKSGLAEFSVNSHTAYYLHAQLARLELKLTSYFQTILLHNNFNMFSNPDFSKSVVVEGCGSSQHDNQLFHLKSAQDFGSPVSGDAMYLVGGASKQPFVAYFARNLIQNPGILPVNLFSVGRQYNPVKSKESPVKSTESPVQSTESPVQSSESPVKSTENPEHSLTNTQQSTAVQVFSVCADKDMMMSQMNLLKDIMTEQLMKFGELRVVDRGVQHLGPSDIKKISFQLYLPGSKQFVEVGSLNVENDYYSRRMMIKQKQNGQYRNVYTVSGQMVNITKLLAVILENEQVDPCKPHQASTPLNLQVLQYLIDVVEFHVQDFNSPPNTPCSH